MSFWAPYFSVQDVIMLNNFAALHALNCVSPCLVVLLIKDTTFQFWTDPKGSRKLRLPEFSRWSAHVGG